MLGLRDEVGGDATRVGRRGGEDEALGGPGRQVDADLAADLDLGRGDPGVAGADDPVDGLEAGLGQAVRQRPDRLGAAGDDEGIDFEQAGRPEEDRVGGAVAVGRATRRRRDRRRRPAPGRRS